MSALSILLLALLLVPFLPRLLRAYLDGFADAPDKMRRLAGGALQLAGRQLTLNGSLESYQVVSFLGGSLLLSVALAGLAIMGYNLFAPALAPILGLNTEDIQLTSGFLGLLAQSTIWALLLVPFVAGVVLGDLLSWGRWTPFSLAMRARRGAFYFAAFTLTWAIVVAICAGAFRATVELESTLGLQRSEQLASYLAAFVVFSVDPLVLLGVFLCTPALEGVFRLVGTVCCSVAYALFSTIGLLLRVIQVVLEPVDIWIRRLISSTSGVLSRWSEATDQGLDKLLDTPRPKLPEQKAAVH